MQPNQSHYIVGPEQVLIDAATPGKIQLPLTDRVYALDTILMRVRTQPFNSTTKGSAAGGDHRHKVFEFSADPYVTPDLQTYFCRVLNSSGGWNQGMVKMYGAANTHVYTYESSGNHTHPVQYGLYRDTQRPGKMMIKVNGSMVAQNVGAKTADFNLTFDITEHIRSKPGGFQTAHDIEITCAEGQGEVLITFDVVELILPFSWKQL